MYYYANTIDDTFYVDAGGYCGPGSATIPGSEGDAEAALGIRCSEGNCCGAAGPVIEESDDSYEFLMSTHIVRTCQTTPEEGSQEAVTVGDWEWTCIVKSANKVVAGVSIVLAMICSYAI